MSGKREKKKKDKGYATKKGRLSYEDERLWARLTLDTLALHSGGNKDDSVIVSIAMEGCTVDRQEDYIQVTDAEDRDYDLIADNEEEAASFEDGIKQNAELWESGEAAAIKNAESDKRQRRERRRSVMEAVMEVGDVPPQSPRLSPRMDDESKRKDKTGKRRQSTVEEVRAADEARIAREAEEQTLQEQKEENKRLQREIEEKELELAAVREKGKSPADISAAKTRIQAELDATYEEELAEIRAEIELQQDQLDEAAIEEAELEQTSEELAERALELETEIEEKNASNEKLKQSVGASMTQEQREQMIEDAEAEARSEIEEEIAASLAAQIQEAREELGKHWEAYIAEQMTEMDAKIEVAEDRLIEAEELAEEAETKNAAGSGSERGDDDDELIQRAAEAANEATDKIEEQTEAKLAQIERDVDSRVAVAHAAHTKNSFDQSENLRQNIKDKRMKVELAKMKRDETKVRLTAAQKKLRDMNAETGEIEYELKGLQNELEGASDALAKRIETEVVQAVEKATADVNASAHAEKEQTVVSTTVRDLRARTADHDIAMKAAQRRAEAAVIARKTIQESIDQTQAALDEAEHQLQQQAKSLPDSRTRDQNEAKLSNDIVVEAKLKDSALATLRKLQSDGKDLLSSIETATEEHSLAKAQLDTDLREFKREKEISWRTTFKSIESEMQVELQNQLKALDDLESNQNVHNSHSVKTANEIQELQSRLQVVMKRSEQVKSSNTSLQDEIKNVDLSINVAEKEAKGAELALTLSTERFREKMQSRHLTNKNQESGRTTSDSRIELLNQFANEQQARRAAESRLDELQMRFNSIKSQAEFDDGTKSPVIAAAEEAARLPVEDRTVRELQRLKDRDPRRLQVYNARMSAEAQWSSYYAQRAGELRSELAEETIIRESAEKQAGETESEARAVERTLEQRRTKAEDRAQQAEETLRLVHGSLLRGYNGASDSGVDSPRSIGSGGLNGTMIAPRIKNSVVTTASLSDFGIQRPQQPRIVHEAADLLRSSSGRYFGHTTVHSREPVQHTPFSPRSRLGVRNLRVSTAENV
eukprot:SAG31_NODE_618_length_13513_cov_87.043164_9_plen_1057_part_00